MPTGQGIHAELLSAPGTSLKVPAAHDWHVVLERAAARVEYFPLEHGVHAAVPFLSLYVPAVHAMHAMPLGPV